MEPQDRSGFMPHWNVRSLKMMENVFAPAWKACSTKQHLESRGQSNFLQTVSTERQHRLST